MTAIESIFPCPSCQSLNIHIVYMVVNSKTIQCNCPPDEKRSQVSPRDFEIEIRDWSTFAINVDPLRHGLTRQSCSLADETGCQKCLDDLLKQCRKVGVVQQDHADESCGGICINCGAQYEGLMDNAQFQAMIKEVLTMAMGRELGDPLLEIKTLCLYLTARAFLEFAETENEDHHACDPSSCLKHAIKKEIDDLKQRLSQIEQAGELKAI